MNDSLVRRARELVHSAVAAAIVSCVIASSTARVAAAASSCGTPSKSPPNRVVHGGRADCNHNGIPDCDDIQRRTSLDCDKNSIPDECQHVTTCHGNSGTITKTLHAARVGEHVAIRLQLDAGVANAGKPYVFVAGSSGLAADGGSELLQPLPEFDAYSSAVLEGRGGIVAPIGLLDDNGRAETWLLTSALARMGSGVLHFGFAVVDASSSGLVAVSRPTPLYLIE